MMTDGSLSVKGVRISNLSILLSREGETIPAHKGDLNKGTANSILKQAGIKGAGKV